MYVFSDEEKLALDTFVTDLRETANHIEKVSELRDSAYIPSMTSHVDTILAGYRQVLIKRERELRAIQITFRDRKLG